LYDHLYLLSVAAMMARRELSMLAIDVTEKMLLEEEERRTRAACGRRSLVSLLEPALGASPLSASLLPVRRQCSSNAKFQVFAMDNLS
jgi:hypothetical protein